MDQKKVPHWSIIIASIGITIGILLLSSVVAFSDTFITETTFINSRVDTLGGETYIRVWDITKFIVGFLFILGSIYIIKDES